MAVRIFKYLQDQSLWHYAIQSNNPEMIYILEDCQFEPNEKEYGVYIEESISCYRSDITNYIKSCMKSQKCFFIQSQFQYN